MDLIINMNVLASFIVSCISIITTLGVALSKRRSAQNKIQDPSTSKETRRYLEHRWNSTRFILKVISGVISAALAALLTTFIVSYLINLLRIIPQFLSEISIIVASLPDVSTIRTHSLQAIALLKDVFVHPNPLGIGIGIVVGLLVAIRIGTSRALEEPEIIYIADTHAIDNSSRQQQP